MTTNFYNNKIFPKNNLSIKIKNLSYKINKNFENGNINTFNKNLSWKIDKMRE